MKCYTDSESHSDYFDDLDVFEEAELDSDSDEEPLRCLDCNLLFVSKNYLYRHLLNHIKQPYVKLEKVQLRNPPLRITFKNRTGHRFEIVSPRQSPLSLDTGYQSSSLEETPRNQGREDFYDPQVGEETENYEDEHEEGSIEAVFCCFRCESKMASTEMLIELVKKYPILYDLSHEDYKNIRKKDKLWDKIGQELHITVCLLWIAYMEKVALHKVSRQTPHPQLKHADKPYVRIIRLSKTKTGQAAKQSKKWQWSKHMENFRPFLTFAKTSSNVPEYLSQTESNKVVNVNDNTQETNISQETKTGDFCETLESNAVTRTDRSDDNATPSRTSKKQKSTKSSTPKATSSVEAVISYFENKKATETKDDLDLLFLSYARTIKKFSGKRQVETKLQIAQIIAYQEIMHYEEESSQQSQQQVLKSYMDVSRPSNSDSFDEDDLVDTEQTRPEENRSFEDLEGSSGNSPANPELAEVRGSHNFSPNLAEVIGGAFLTDLDSPFDEHSPERTQSGEGTENAANVEALSSEGQTIAPHYGGIPGAQPTPPPEPSPTGVSEYPKIKIKTTGLFKDPEPRSGCTITEITESDSSDGPSSSSTNNATPVWPNPGMDDPLKLPDSENLLSMFNSDRSNKDIGYSTGTDNEFISLDTSSAVATTSSLDSLTGLPMQALAQQVSRLNPSAGQGLHQQNVLINIQQFPTQPQQQYQAPHGQMPQHQP
ncbi:hypothetical protein HUJ04_012885, partial [Dendroctonus ponderosae]